MSKRPAYITDPAVMTLAEAQQIAREISNNLIPDNDYCLDLALDRLKHTALYKRKLQFMYHSVLVAALKMHGCHPQDVRRARYQMREEDAGSLQSESLACGLLALKAAHQLIELSNAIEGGEGAHDWIKPTWDALGSSGPLHALNDALSRSTAAVLKALEVSELYPRALERVNKISGESK